MIGTMPDIDKAAPWQEKSIAWLVAQGPTTVLLFLIVVGIWKEMPNVIGSVQSGYNRNAQDLTKTALVYQATTERMMEQMSKDRDVMIEMAKENRARINLLFDQLQRNEQLITKQQ